jgi:hypothetical protein
MSANDSTGRTRNRLERERRKVAGLCYVCGCKPAPGMKTCPACLDRQRKKYAGRRAFGLCIYCGRPAVAGKTGCHRCQRVQRAASKSVRAANAAAGLCFCGAAPPRPGKKTCERCSRRGRASQLRRRAAGLCRCGRHPAVTGHTTCQPCIEYKRSRWEQFRIAVFNGYGGRCACCGENDPNVLELDHVNNDGSSHRQEVGSKIYKWAFANGFPDRLQVLCANCHRARTRTGDCSYRARR